MIDTHAHYQDTQFEKDRTEIFEQMPQKGIEAAINIGTTMQDSHTTIALAKQYDYLYATVGVHPNETGALTQEDLTKLQELAMEEKVVAIGEIGLDYHWEEPEKSIQKKWFVQQIELAKTVKKPIVLHSREAAKDTFDLIIETKAAQVGGVVHCYSYSLEMAKQYLDLGFYLGIGGIVTFSNAKKLKEVVAYAPLQQLLLETDAPYLAPTPYRGTRNSSFYLPYVRKEIAGLKGVTEEVVEEMTTQNAKALFGI